MWSSSRHSVYAVKKWGVCCLWWALKNRRSLHWTFENIIYKANRLQRTLIYEIKTTTMAVVCAVVILLLMMMMTRRDDYAQTKHKHILTTDTLLRYHTWCAPRRIRWTLVSSSSSSFFPRKIVVWCKKNKRKMLAFSMSIYAQFTWKALKSGSLINVRYILELFHSFLLILVQYFSHNHKIIPS